MKKTQFKDAVRNIGNRKVSFLSLCLVVALGLGALFTTRYMGAGLEEKFSGYYNDRNFKDFEMIASLGVSESNLNKIRSAEGVTAVEGVIQADGTISFGDEKRNVTVISRTSEISVPELVEGNAPTTKSECMVGEDFAEIEGIKVGDKVRISLTGLDALGDKQPLYEKEFTVTGLMHHPDYMRRKSVSTVVLPLEAFDKEATDGLYTRAFIRSETPDGIGMFSEEYFEENADTKKALEDLEAELGADRTKEMKDDANAEIDKEWKKALAQLDEAQQEIDDGEAELAARLADGREKLNNAENTLARTVAGYRKQIRDGEAELKKYRDLLSKADEMAKEIKKQNDELRKIYNKDIARNLKDIAELEKQIEEIRKVKDLYPEQYEELVKKLAQLIIDKLDEIESVVEFFNKPEVKELVEEIKTVTDGKVDFTKIVAAIAGTDVDKLAELARTIINGDADIKEMEQFIKELEGCINNTKEYLKKLDEKDAYIKQFEDNRSKIVSRLDNEEKKLEDSKKKLAAEERKYQAQINAGWSTYYAEKAKYEAQLEEAKLLLEENREEAEKKLAEARAEVEKMEPCRWITLDRSANAGYVDVRSNLKAIRSAGNVFGILFMIVTAIVCLSTLVIIIDEQKNLVGTVKAFGFLKGEVLGKYLLFGIAAALVGSLLAAGGGYILSTIVQGKYAEAAMYQAGAARTIFTPGVTIAATLLITAVAVIASIAACTDILRSPASVLMKGGTAASEKKNSKKKKEASTKGSLYSRLIIRNMLEDKARVIVTVAIIAFSCMLIGMGFSMKFAYDGMSEKQIGDVNKYDFRLTMNDDVSDEESAKLAKVLADSNTAYLPATTKTMLYKWDGRIDGLQLICADPEKLNDFYAVADPKTGEKISLPKDGILIQQRMNESYKMNEGDMLPIFDSSLKENKAEIKGFFTNYVGRTVVISPAAYKSVFGEKNETNSYYVRLNGMDKKTLQSKLLAVTDEISFTERDEFKTKFESVAMLYDIIVIIITGIAILISFMILTNLANIFLTRRKTELSVMRVNGFSIKQARGYLTKETVFTTTAGLVLGVILGALLTPPVISIIQQPDLEFVKSFHPVAWVVAVAIEAVFAILINSTVFRKVKDLNLRDIA